MNHNRYDEVKFQSRILRLSQIKKLLAGTRAFLQSRITDTVALPFYPVKSLEGKNV